MLRDGGEWGMPRVGGESGVVDAKSWGRGGMLRVEGERVGGWMLRVEGRGDANPNPGPQSHLRSSPSSGCWHPESKRGRLGAGGDLAP